MIKSRRMSWAGHVARMGALRYSYKILVGNSEGKRPIGRLKERWEDNIKMDINDTVWEGVELILLTQWCEVW
jgi:hypothetical protein